MPVSCLLAFDTTVQGLSPYSTLLHLLCIASTTTERDPIHPQLLSYPATLTVRGGPSEPAIIVSDGFKGLPLCYTSPTKHLYQSEYCFLHHPEEGCHRWGLIRPMASYHFVPLRSMVTGQSTNDGYVL